MGSLKMAEKQAKNSKAKHLEKHQFKPGKSGNPGGRPKDNLRAMARESSEKALATIVTLMANGRSERVRLQAALAVLAYAWGKPTQMMEGHQSEGIGPLIIKTNVFGSPCDDCTNKEVLLEKESDAEGL